MRPLWLAAGLIGAIVCASGAHAGALTPSEPSASVALAPGDTGVAAWHGEAFDGRITAAGDRFDMYALTAAHASLPFNSLVEVTNLANGKSVVVRVNDRPGPASNDLIVVSKAAATSLGFVDEPTARVRIAVLAEPTSDSPY
jgi:rare lipoprotein A